MKCGKRMRRVKAEKLCFASLLVLGFIRAWLAGCGPHNPIDLMVKAARDGDTNRVIQLLAKGVPVNAAERRMLLQTPLAAAALGENGAHLDVTDSRGNGIAYTVY